MYHDDITLLSPRADIRGNVILIPEDWVHRLSYDIISERGENTCLYVFEALICPESDIPLLAGKRESDMEYMFGETDTDMEKELFVVLFDTFDEKVIGVYRDEDYWRPIVYSDIVSVENIGENSEYDYRAFAVTRKDFVSGWFRTLRVYAVNYGSLISCDPLVIDAEDLSGGEASSSIVEYRNLRVSDNSLHILIDRIEDGRRETLTLLSFGK
jgi:hypothetical protein